VYSQRR